VGNPVASRHRWRIGHESVASCQTKQVKFRIKFSIFFFS
jgi:hypothetical protein